MSIFSQLTDAIFEPLAARQQVEAARFSASATANSILLEVAELHFELLAAEADLRVRRESAAQEAEVARLTRAYADAQQGREADAERAATELSLIVDEVRQAEEEVAVASARLAHRLHLDQSVRLRPVAPAVEMVTIVDPGVALAGPDPGGLAAPAGGRGAGRRARGGGDPPPARTLSAAAADALARASAAGRSAAAATSSAPSSPTSPAGPTSTSRSSGRSATWASATSRSRSGDGPRSGQAVGERSRAIAAGPQRGQRGVRRGGGRPATGRHHHTPARQRGGRLPRGPGADPQHRRPADRGRQQPAAAERRRGSTASARSPITTRRSSGCSSPWAHPRRWASRPTRRSPRPDRFATPAPPRWQDRGTNAR